MSLLCGVRRIWAREPVAGEEQTVKEPRARMKRERGERPKGRQTHRYEEMIECHKL